MDYGVFAAGMTIGMSCTLVLAFMKANLRCRHCDAKQQEIGSLKATIEAMTLIMQRMETQHKEALEYLRQQNDRLLLSVGVFKHEKTPEHIAAEEEEKRVEKEIAEIRAKGGEVFGE